MIDMNFDLHKLNAERLEKIKKLGEKEKIGLVRHVLSTNAPINSLGRENYHSCGLQNTCVEILRLRCIQDLHDNEAAVYLMMFDCANCKNYRNTIEAAWC